MISSSEIRRKFLDFFQKKQHQIVPSDSILRKDDPTLMFTNSGMAQFKNIFIGNETRKYLAVADSQKCLRVSGKHNDLEEVGKDTYHHTFFEMLGNWSFGDYFKERAIDLAWEFLVTELKINPNHLYVTVFEGNEQVPFDQEAANFWKKHLSEERILKGNTKDNFWEMGEIGPCGPCSEIHIDLREESEKAKVSGASLINKDHPQVIEIWNLVFMEFSRKKDQSLAELPAKNIDTGMGLERLAMVLQGKKSTYDTDLFGELIDTVEQITQIKYGTNQQTDIAIRVVVDHIRTIAFCIADGLIPSNNKEGYVLRRILRRAIRYGYSFLNLQEAFMFRLIKPLVTQMGEAYPELKQQQKLIHQIVLEEEKSFLKTLSVGLTKLEKHLSNLPKDKVISGKFVFELYDTFGFPIDLTSLILKEQNRSYHHREYLQEMEQQKTRARAATEKSYSDWTYLSAVSETKFVGYDQTEHLVKLLAFRKVDEAKQSYYQLIFNETPFYCESGGQKGDSGLIRNDFSNFSITSTIKDNNQIVHISPDFEPVSEATTFEAKVNLLERKKTSTHHSATHLLHFALREVLGKQVEQKGSLVTPKGLRFDFSHFQKVSAAEIEKIEQLVQAQINACLPLEENRNCDYQQAVEQGAMALFGEKYSDAVRTIKFGNSYELCGGTHVSNTADILRFKITKETASSAGIRRIEALAGISLIEKLEEQAEDLTTIAKQLNSPKKVVEAVQKLQTENQQLTAEIDAWKQKEINAICQDIIKSNPIEVSFGRAIIFELNTEPKLLKKMVATLNQQHSGLNQLVILLNHHPNQPSILIAKIGSPKVTLGANEILDNLKPHFREAKGGGNPKMASLSGVNANLETLVSKL